MAELPMKTLAIVIIFVVIAAIALVFIFSGWEGTSTSESLFNLSKNITSNATKVAGQESKLKPLFG